VSPKSCHMVENNPEELDEFGDAVMP